MPDQLQVARGAKSELPLHACHAARPFKPRCLPVASLLIALTAPLALLLPAPRAAGLEPIATLAPDDVPEGFGNGFGWSVAISGDYVAVGAPFDPWYNGSATGAVYVFRRIGPRWIQQAKLVNPDPIFEAQFGLSLAMDGDVIVVGAPVWQPYNACDLRRAGAIYVYRRHDQGTPEDPADDTWLGEGKLLAIDPLHARGLGISVAIADDVIVGGTDCGESAAVFRRSERVWMHEAALLALDSQVRQKFGYSVAIGRDITSTIGTGPLGAIAGSAAIGTQRIAIGAPSYKQRRGAAYVFVRSNGEWISDALLTVEESTVSDPSGCGTSVAVVDREVMVGCPYENDQWPSLNSGAVYLFNRLPGAQWVSQTKLIPRIRRDLGEFGLAIACDSTQCLIAPDTSWDPNVYLFERAANQWIETGTLRAGEYPHFAIYTQNEYGAVGNAIYVVRNRKSMREYADFQNCFGGDTESPDALECDPFDVASDGRVDLYDFEEFMATFAGP